MGRGSGGRGGEASVHADDSTAEGGRGGDAAIGNGGDGGRAMVAADRSHAVGGAGGRGGAGDGGRGGDACVLPDGARLAAELRARPVTPSDTYISINGKIVLVARGGQSGDVTGRGADACAFGSNSFSAGGQGGEAQQPGGRGGRGGRSYMPDGITKLPGRPNRAHMRWPYYEPITEPGRGSDGIDTPQYKARRLILEQIKKQYCAQSGLPLHEAWWDREIIPLAWINDRLKADGHFWRASVVDDEYEFSDEPKAERAI